MSEDSNPLAPGQTLSMTEFMRKSAEKRAQQALDQVDAGVPAFLKPAVAKAIELSEKGALVMTDIWTIITAAGYRPSYNVVMMRPEVYDLWQLTKPPAPMTDGLHGEIIDALRVIGEFSNIKVVKNTLCNYRTAERALSAMIWDPSNRRNPITEGLTNAMTSGFEPGSFDHFLSHFKDRDGNAAAFIKKFMMGCIAREVHGFQNYTLILQGRQGLGKSTIVQWLCGVVGLDYYQEGVILPHDKDHRLRLAKKFLWGADEFGETFAKTSQNALKGFLTQEQINERPPYGRYDIQCVRHCNIIATTNDSQFLCDPTGNRRYLTLHLTELNHDYSKNLTPEAVWGDLMMQMFSMPKGEEPWKLTSEEMTAQSTSNRASEEEDQLEIFLEESFERTENKGSQCKLRANEIYTPVFHRFHAHGDLREENSLMRRVKTILTQKWGVESVKSNGVMVFYGISKKSNPPYT